MLHLCRATGILAKKAQFPKVNQVINSPAEILDIQKARAVRDVQHLFNTGNFVLAIQNSWLDVMLGNGNSMMTFL